MLGTVMQQSMFLSNTGIHINYDVDNGHDDLGSDEDDNYICIFVSIQLNLRDTKTKQKKKKKKK